MGVGSRIVGQGLVAALVTLVLVGLPGGAGAVGTGNPVIVSPASTAKHYDGYTGPFVVDFSNAPAATYHYEVTRAPSETVASGDHPWSGTGSSSYSFPTPPLPPGNGYTFSITDGAGHSDSLAFAVRSGAQPTCTLLAPRAIRVNAAEKPVVGRLGDDCATAHVGYASWDVFDQGGGYVSTLLFDGVAQNAWTYFDNGPLGTYTSVPNTATNPADDDIGQNTPRTVIRLASRVALTGSRVGSYVTLRALLTRYRPVPNAFRAWHGRTVVLSYRTCSTCAWHRLAARTTNREGRVSLRFQARTTRTYRARAFGTTTTWAPYPDRARR